jgi:hypothetical protein
MYDILRHPDEAVERAVSKTGIGKSEICDILFEIKPYRNESAHGSPMDMGTVEALRSDWFGWNGYAGGIFGVLIGVIGPHGK